MYQAQRQAALENTGAIISTHLQDIFTYHSSKLSKKTLEWNFLKQKQVQKIVNSLPYTRGSSTIVVASFDVCCIEPPGQRAITEQTS